MKIIISPSKLQSPSEKRTVLKEPKFLAKSQALRQQLTEMSKAELAEFFALKAAKLEEVFAFFHEESQVSYSPFELYSGIVFQEINYRSYQQEQLNYLLRHGVVLSAMYGVLEANSGIRPYRLDFSKKLKQQNLYQYWQREIDQYFRQTSLVVNLASKEYSKLLKNFQGKLVSVFFKEESPDGQLKTITVHNKQMRGIMFDYFVQNCIEDVNEIKNFSENAYVYRSELSTEWDWVFVKGL